MISIATFINQFSEVNKPTRQTVANWCKYGHIAARQFGKGGKWWIYEEHELAKNQIMLTGDPLVDRILNERA